MKGKYKSANEWAARKKNMIPRSPYSDCFHLLVIVLTKRQTFDEWKSSSLNINKSQVEQKCICFIKILKIPVFLDAFFCSFKIKTPTIYSLHLRWAQKVVLFIKKTKKRKEKQTQKNEKEHETILCKC